MIILFTSAVNLIKEYWREKSRRDFLHFEKKNYHVISRVYHKCKSESCPQVVSEATEGPQSRLSVTLGSEDSQCQDLPDLKF